MSTAPTADLHPHPATDTLALAVLVLGAVTIGFAPILVRLTETGPAAGGFWRLALAVPALLAMHVLAQRSHREVTGRGLNLGLIAGVLFAGDLAFWHYGVSMTSVANATVLSNLAPIVVAVMAWAVLRERPRPLFALGVLIGVVGAMGMAFFAEHKPGASNLLGDALAASTAVWYGLYLLVVNRARRSAPAASIMFYSTLAGAPAMLLAALAMQETIMPASAAGWAACAGLAALHVVGQGAIAWALGRVRATLASVVILVQPVVAAVAGALLFQETLTPLQIVAGIVALAGVVLARLASNPRAAPAAEPS